MAKRTGKPVKVRSRKATHRHRIPPEHYKVKTGYLYWITFIEELERELDHDVFGKHEFHELYNVAGVKLATAGAVSGVPRIVIRTLAKWLCMLIQLDLIDFNHLIALILRCAKTARKGKKEAIDGGREYLLEAAYMNMVPGAQPPNFNDTTRLNLPLVFRHWMGVRYDDFIDALKGGGFLLPTSDGGYTFPDGVTTVSLEGDVIPRNREPEPDDVLASIADPKTHGMRPNAPLSPLALDRARQARRAREEALREQQRQRVIQERNRKKAEENPEGVAVLTDDGVDLEGLGELLDAIPVAGQAAGGLVRFLDQFI